MAGALVFENFGTHKNMHNAQVIPKTDKNGILFKPQYCAIADESKGPIANPKLPQAMNIPMFLTGSFLENFTTNPRDCGWKRLEPRLPRIIHKSITLICEETGTSEMKIDVNSNPQKINARFRILSAKNPKYGCNKDEKMCEQLKIIVATGIEILICSAINGIIGFRSPVYISFTKCAEQSHLWAVRSFFSSIIIS